MTQSTVTPAAGSVAARRKGANIALWVVQSLPRRGEVAR